MNEDASKLAKDLNAGETEGAILIYTAVDEG